jgi:alkylation response protein AidB-like acyl-CoA dehydrogenase
MTTTHESVATYWLNRARELEPVILAHIEQAGHERKVPEPVIQAFRDAGFLRMLAPRAFGGDQVALPDALPVFEELARQDGGTGWTLMFAATSPMFGDYLPEAAAREIYGADGSILASNFSPKGALRPVDGGYRFSGRWPFMSGCIAAEWHIVAGFIVDDDGAPVLGADGQPQHTVAVVPASDAEILDTWHTTGMRATGSHDIVVKDVFVPEERSFTFDEFMAGPSRANAGYHRPFFELAPGLLSSIALGIGTAAIEALVAMAPAKTPVRSTTRLADQQVVQERVGRATALVGAARAYVRETVRAVNDRADDSTPLLGVARLSATHAAACAAEAVGLMYDAGGGSSIYESSRLEACFRDVNTVTHHFFIASGGYAAVGQELLGRRAEY